MKEIAGLLEEQASIPMVREQLALIEEVQSDEWWQDVTVADARRRAQEACGCWCGSSRRQKRKTDLHRLRGRDRAARAEIDLLGYRRPRGQLRAVPRQGPRLPPRSIEDHIAIHELRMNKPLTPSDLAELERMLAERAASAMPRRSSQQAAEDAQGLGLFVRSLVGLDRGAPRRPLPTSSPERRWRELRSSSWT